MSTPDGVIYFDSRIDPTNFDKDAKSLQKKLGSVMKGIEKMSVGIENAAKVTPAAITSAKKKMIDLQYTIDETEKALEAMGNKEIFSKEFMTLRKEEDKLSKQLEGLFTKISARESQLWDGRGSEPVWLYEQDKAWLKLKGKIEETELAIEKVQKKLSRYEGSNGFDTESYRRLNAELEKAKEEYAVLNDQVEKFADNSDSAFDGITKSAAKFGKMFKLMIARAILREMINQIGEGFQNLAKYSSSFNKTMSNMKSSLSGFRNSLATAFAPIVEIAIPFLSRLVDWLTVAMNALAKFFSALSGKKTYTKATKAAESYAEAAGAAADAAERGARAFDEFNEIESGKSSGGGAGGGVDVGEMFEEIEIESGFLKHLETIRKVVEDIGILLAAWSISKAFKKDYTSVAGTLLSIKGGYDMLKDTIEALNNGVTLDNIVQLLIDTTELAAGLTLVFGEAGGGIALVIGGLAMFGTGIKDLLTGNYSPAALTSAILGIGAAGAGLALLIGSWGPLLFAAVAGVFTVILTGISQNWEELKSIWTNNELNFFDKIKESCTLLGDWAGDFLHDMFGEILGFFGLTWESIQDVFSPVTDWFEDKFTDAWTAVKNVFSDGGQIFEGIKEGISATFKKIVNNLISGINNVIAKPFNNINSMLSTIRNVEILGSKPFRGIGRVSVPQIPKLATGAVIPANREFLAILGDQNKGTNIETPESLLRQIMREELDSEGSDDRPIYINVRFGNSTMKRILIGTLKDIRKTSGVEVSLG